MRYCPVCENLLVSRNGKLYCRTCDINLEVPRDTQKENIAIKVIKHDVKDFDPALIVGELDEYHVTEEYRESHEDFFTNEQEI